MIGHVAQTWLETTQTILNVFKHNTFKNNNDITFSILKDSADKIWYHICVAI